MLNDKVERYDLIDIKKFSQLSSYTDDVDLNEN